MKHIAITGGIACGKSTVAGWLPELGGEVLDTDAVVHELEAPGGAAVAPILDAFGAGVGDGRGGVDRRRLARRVFGDAAALARLNGIVHPLVAERLEAWLAAPAAPGVRFKAALVPLLHEVGWQRPRWDAVVAVVCSEMEQVRRLVARGLNEAEARARIAAQLPAAEKARRSDHVIANDDDRETLRAATGQVVRALLESD